MRPNRTLMAAFFAVTELMLWMPHAGAQSRPDPSDPAARVPAAAYRSPFDGYRKLGEEPVGNWRSANDEVGRIGGWREYAREAQESGPKLKGSTPADPGATPKTGHEGHKMPGGKP
jgi:hypothetical protein